MSIGLVVAALYDVIFTFRASGDPTLSVVDITGSAATTINNPGFRDGRSGIKPTAMGSYACLPITRDFPFHP